jgi:hypothetical protein
VVSTSCFRSATKIERNVTVLWFVIRTVLCQCVSASKSGNERCLNGNTMPRIGERNELKASGTNVIRSLGYCKDALRIMLQETRQQDPVLLPATRNQCEYFHCGMQ